MNTKESLLAQAIVDAVQHLYQQTVEVSTLQFQETRREFEGDVTVVVCKHM
jgi:hypothetical protein